MGNALAFRVGEMVGMLAMFAFIAVLTLFVNRARRANATPYLAAGCICLLLTLPQTESLELAELACYIIWLMLLWRYKLESNAQSTGLARLNAVAHALLLIGAVASLWDAYGLSRAGGLAAFGMTLIGGGVIWKWVRMVPLRSPKQ